MQHFILLLSIIILTSIECEAQCDGKITWHATHEEFLDSSGTVRERMVDTVFLETTKKTFLYEKSGGVREGIEGTVTESTCNWSEPFKNGRSFYKIRYMVPGSENKFASATITIIGENGKLVATLHLLDKRRAIRLQIDKYGFK
jgi:hypothetical protein